MFKVRQQSKLRVLFSEFEKGVMEFYSRGYWQWISPVLAGHIDHDRINGMRH